MTAVIAGKQATPAAHIRGSSVGQLGEMCATTRSPMKPRRHVVVGAPLAARASAALLRTLAPRYIALGVGCPSALFEVTVLSTSSFAVRKASDLNASPGIRPAAYAHARSGHGMVHLKWKPARRSEQTRFFPLGGDTGRPSRSDWPEAMHAAQVVRSVHRCASVGNVTSATPIIESRVTISASCSSLQSSVPVGRSGNTR